MYRSDKEDMSYLGNYYTYNDSNRKDGSYSLTLLASKVPVDIEATLADADNCDLMTSDYD